MIRYKGYFGEFSYDNDAKIYYGEVIGLKDVITFCGYTKTEAEQAFRDSIEEYINWCYQRREESEKIIK